jgi:hypothetical protein
MSGGATERSPGSEDRDKVHRNNNPEQKEKPRTQETQGTEHFPKNQYHNKS